MHSVSPNAKLKYGNVFISSFIEVALRLSISNQLIVIFFITLIAASQVPESTHEVEKGE